MHVNVNCRPIRMRHALTEILNTSGKTDPHKYNETSTGSQYIDLISLKQQINYWQLQLYHNNSQGIKNT